MGESRISADWLLSGANTLYIVAPANDQRRLSGLFAALVSHIVAGAYERSAKTGRPIDPALLLALDEVCNIAPLPNLDEIASTGPGQGVHLLCVLQNISQSYDRWGRDRAETIIANHRARLFCSGIGDRATLDYLRGTLGEEEIARISTQQRGIASPRRANPQHRAPATRHPAPHPPGRPLQQPARLRPPRARLDHPPRPPRHRRPASDRQPPADDASNGRPRRRTRRRHPTRPRSSTRERPLTAAGTETAHGVPAGLCRIRWIAFAQCRRPPAGRLQGRQRSLPLARGLGSAPAAGRRFGLRQPPDPTRREQR